MAGRGVDVGLGGPAADGQPDRGQGAILVQAHRGQDGRGRVLAAVAGGAGGGGDAGGGGEQLVAAQPGDADVERGGEPPAWRAVELDLAGQRRGQPSSVLA
jgi:hypothetical protein